MPGILPVKGVGPSKGKYHFQKFHFHSPFFFYQTLQMELYEIPTVLGVQKSQWSSPFLFLVLTVYKFYIISSFNKSDKQCQSYMKRERERIERVIKL